LWPRWSCALLLATLVGACTPSTRIAAVKATDYTAQPKRLFVVAVLDGSVTSDNRRDFSEALQRSIHACGVAVEVFLKSPLSFDDVEAQHRLAFQPDTVLIVRPLSRATNGYGAVIGTVHLAELSVAAAPELPGAPAKVVWKAEIGMGLVYVNHEVIGETLAQDLANRMKGDGLFPGCRPDAGTRTATGTPTRAAPTLASAAKPPVHGTGAGTGFAINAKGIALTNNHVVASCSSIEFTHGEMKGAATIVARDAVNDLALLKLDGKFTHLAAFRDGRGIRAGDNIVVVGFPLGGLLGSEPNVTTGGVTSLSGIANDSRFMQITAPVQAGDSGSPLLDMSGSIVGIVTSKLNVVAVAKITGDLPQNVNFAVKSSVIRTFLEANNIDYTTAPSTRAMSAADVADVAREFTLAIQCHHDGTTAAAAPAPGAAAKPPAAAVDSATPPSRDGVWEVSATERAETAVPGQAGQNSCSYNLRIVVTGNHLETTLPAGRSTAHVTAEIAEDGSFKSGTGTNGASIRGHFTEDGLEVVTSSSTCPRRVGYGHHAEAPGAAATPPAPALGADAAPSRDGVWEVAANADGALAGSSGVFITCSYALRIVVTGNHLETTLPVGRTSAHVTAEIAEDGSFKSATGALGAYIRGHFAGDTLEVVTSSSICPRRDGQGHHVT
jgi:S1-C subfamily serine protease